MCVCVCVCGESVCLSLESAGVCHFQMNHRQTGRPVYEPQTHLLADLSSLCPAETSICICIMNHITTYRTCITTDRLVDL